MGQPWNPSWSLKLDKKTGGKGHEGLRLILSILLMVEIEIKFRQKKKKKGFLSMEFSYDETR